MDDSASGNRPESGPTEARLPLEIREGIRARDPEALAVLFDTHFGEVYNLAHRLLGNRAAAEDATHDVFLKVHRAAPSYEPSRDPLPWLITITYNVCRDFWRSRSHRLDKMSQPFDSSEPIAQTLASDRPTPNGDLARKEQEQIVSEALMELPDEQRAIVLFHDFERLTHEEIAEIVGISPVAVRKRYSRALAKLHDRLKGKLP